MGAKARDSTFHPGLDSRLPRQLPNAQARAVGMASASRHAPVLTAHVRASDVASCGALHASRELDLALPPLSGQACGGRASWHKIRKQSRSKAQIASDYPPVMFTRWGRGPAGRTLRRISVFVHHHRRLISDSVSRHRPSLGHPPLQDGRRVGGLVAHVEVERRLLLVALAPPRVVEDAAQPEQALGLLGEQREQRRVGGAAA